MKCNCLNIDFLFHNIVFFPSNKVANGIREHEQNNRCEFLRFTVFLFVLRGGIARRKFAPRSNRDEVWKEVKRLPFPTESYIMSTEGVGKPFHQWEMKRAISSVSSTKSLLAI